MIIVRLGNIFSLMSDMASRCIGIVQAKLYVLIKESTNREGVIKKEHCNLTKIDLFMWNENVKRSRTKVTIEGQCFFFFFFFFFLNVFLNFKFVFF